VLHQERAAVTTMEATMSTHIKKNGGAADVARAHPMQASVARQAHHATPPRRPAVVPLIRVRKGAGRSAIRVGIIGCGYWGPNLVRNLNALNGCEVRWMCDLNESRLSYLKRLYPGIRTTRNHEDILADGRVDAVVIATPVSTHYPLARSSLLAGKHTFVEKPMARSSAECADLVGLARSRHRNLTVGHTFLYSAPVRKIKEIIDRGDIGRVRYISARRLNLGLFQKDINVTWDLAPHDISIILHLLGEMPVSVNCRGHANVTPGVEDVTTTCLNFERMGFATIQNSWLDPLKVREMTIVGERRMILYDDVAPMEKVKVFDARVERPPHYDTFAEFQYSYHYGDMYVPHLAHEEPLKVECSHFLECIRTCQPPLTSGEDGLKMVRILEAASASLKDGGAEIHLTADGPASRPAMV
jgi:predicted dehydrogenase